MASIVGIYSAGRMPRRGLGAIRNRTRSTRLRVDVNKTGFHVRKPGEWNPPACQQERIKFWFPERVDPANVGMRRIDHACAWLSLVQRGHGRELAKGGPAAV
jgi:hypothetical protein